MRRLAQAACLTRGTLLAWLLVMLMIVCIALLVVAVGVGNYGHSRVGAVSWSPAGLVVVVFAILWLSGRFA